jgi:DNA replication protein DnaC
MGLGERYWPARLAKLSEHQRAKINDYVSSLDKYIRQGVGLYLWGENSRGKTYIASALCKYVWGMYRVASYLITAPDLYDATKSDYPAHEGSEETVLGRAQKVRFLVIDDLGREYRAKTGFFESELSSILRNRIRSKKTTVITSNLDPKRIAPIYGESVFELLKSSMRDRKLVGENWREREGRELSRFL